MADDIEKIAANDPDRCQAVSKIIGQCQNKSMTGSKYCKIHGGVIDIIKEKKKSLRIYRLTKWQAKANAKLDIEDNTDLAEELALLRVILEEKINFCSDTSDLLLQSGPIAEIVMKIEKLVGAISKLTAYKSQNIPKEALVQFGMEIVGIVSNHIDDSITLEAISDEILESIVHLSQEEE